MAKTYAQATFVLVLDAEIQQISSNIPARELLVRISCCGWMRRVWTLLEGSLGSEKLCVQTSDGALRLGSARKKLLDDWESERIVTDSIAVDVGIFHRDLEFMRIAFSATNVWPRDINSQPTAFGVALHGFIGRATSWKGDEAICLAILLGRSPAAIEKLQQVPAETRASELLSCLDHVPHGLLFCAGPKLKQPGYRWMRREFWRARPYAYYRPTRLRPDVGLEVTLPGFILSPMILPRKSFQFHNTRSCQWYKASYDETLPDSLWSELLNQLCFVPETSQLGIICPTLQLTRSAPNELDHVPAALVLIYKRSNTTLNILDLGRTAICTRYICYLELALPSQDEIESEKSKHGEDWSRYMGEAEKASIYVGEALRNRLGLRFLSEHKEEWLEQTWYVS